MIAKKDLEDGEYYQGRSRNAKEARWSAEREVFEYLDDGPGGVFIDTVYHFDDAGKWDYFDAKRKSEVPQRPFPEQLA